MIIILQFISLILFSTVLIFDTPNTIIDATEIRSESALSDTITYLNIPERSKDAIGGFKFADQISGLSIEKRDKAIIEEIMSGNVPSFSRTLRQTKIKKKINFKNYELTFFTVCDYMAIGSDHDYLYIPMMPSTAQYLADQMDCSLPTKKIVDIIYDRAEIKMVPQPIPPSDKMTNIPVFIQHTDSVKHQISQLDINRSAIIAGHKKDIIISNKIYSPDRNFDRVVIYGWHLSTNNPIQPVFNGHNEQYVDYSHGVRLISNVALLNGESINITEVLQDPILSVILSSEGIINKPYYR